MPIPTPFYPRTSALCASHEWRSWSGYLAAVTYEISHEREYYAVRNSAGLFDISPLYKYDLVGPDAQRLLNKVMTRDLAQLSVGQLIYTPWCDEEGKIIDDGVAGRLDEDHFRVTAADPNLRWLTDAGWGLNVDIRDRSRDLAALALQGPNAREIARRVVDGVDFDNLAYFRLAHGRLEDTPLVVSRTGYTGDLGYELWLPAGRALLLWDALMEIGQDYGLLPAGLAALDIARIEAGLPLIEVDYISAHRALTEAQKSSPYEAGLGWTVALDKGWFIGWDPLRQEKESGPKWDLVGLEIDWVELEKLFNKVDLPPQVAGRASRAAVPVFGYGRQIGQVTSSAFSPILKKYIGLATVEKGFASLETELEVEATVEFERKKVKAIVVQTPFFNPPRKRA